MLQKAVKRAAKAASKQTAGQKKIEKATKGQRAYARGQMKGAAAAAGVTAGLAGLGIAELNRRLKEAETEKERAQIQVAIEKTIRQMAQEEAEMNKKSKGGMPKKYAKGGYANCGASMKPTQKSSKMAYGGMSRKK
jgi:hypothetical protein